MTDQRKSENRCDGVGHQWYKRNRDNSPTRQFTDTHFEDSSPTELKTVHRQNWRQFIDIFYIVFIMNVTIFTFNWDTIKQMTNRHFSVTPYITICPSTETYFGHYLRGAVSAVTGIYLFRLLLNIIFFVLRSSVYLKKSSAYHDEMPHDGISAVYKCKKTCTKNIYFTIEMQPNIFF